MVNKTKILVVDDDQDIVDLITIMLESSGYDVISADSGEGCIEILKKEKPNLIILDIMMETMTEGFNVGYTIRSNPDYSSIPVLLISAIDKHTGFHIDTGNLPADAFLEKPLDPVALLKSIEQLLQSGKKYNCTAPQ